MSTKVAAMPAGRARISATSCGVIGSSGTDFTDHHTVVIENTAPIRKATRVTCGMWLSPTASLFMPIHTRIEGAR
jgi:hypothetical protein